ncbi:hypothetical protein [Actinomadura luteofluorescens]|uniref:hypothetical protein n=1 Tax=Actinomadura luteofluorescens TaxID=46163 RepID=UPI003D8AE1DA
MTGQPTPQAAGTITALLLGEAVVALENTAATLNLSKTDTVNRALLAYAYLTALQSSGGEIYVKETAGGDMRRLALNHDA